MVHRQNVHVSDMFWMTMMMMMMMMTIINDAWCGQHDARNIKTLSLVHHTLHGIDSTVSRLFNESLAAPSRINSSGTGANMY